MAGVEAEGLILCAMDPIRQLVRIIEPPEGCMIGERVYFGEEKLQTAPLVPLTLNKRKLWPKIQLLMGTAADGTVLYNGIVMRTSAGPVLVPDVPCGIVTGLWGREVNPDTTGGGNWVREGK